MLRHHLQQCRKQRWEAGLERLAVPCEQPQAVVLVQQGRRLLNFAGNDYLGLRQHPQLKAALARAVAEKGAGSGSAHLISGHDPAHARLETTLAEWLGYEAALLFPSGYQANLALMAGLLPRKAPVLLDKLAHASLIDGARLAGAHLRRFRHNDVNHARHCLELQQPWLLSTEGVFSMDGDTAPLQALAALCGREACWLHVDDAHGFGVRAEGRGSVAAAGLTARQVPLLTITFGKAMGMSGAAILGERAVMEHLQNHARPWIYSTATPPAWAQAGLQAVVMLQQADEARARLQAHVERFRQGAESLGLKPPPGQGPIQILPLASNEQALRWGAQLRQQGLMVGVIRPPTSPTPRLRLTFSAAHADVHVQQLLQALAQLREAA